MENIAVFFGGKSTENEISIITGVMALNVLDKEKYKVIPVYIDTNGTFKTHEEMFNVSSFKDKKELFDEVILLNGILYKQKRNRLKEIAKIDCALNCCHGQNGEDGFVSSILKMNDIPSASPNLLSSAVFMDKVATRLIAESLSIATPQFLKINEFDYDKRKRIVLRYIEKTIKYPMIIKPNSLGSSIGISVAKNIDELEDALSLAFEYDSTVIVERFLEDKLEVNCACYRKEDKIITSHCESPKSMEDFFTFEEKYLKDGKTMQGYVSAKLTDEQCKRIQAYTRLLYKKFDMIGIVRADFLISDGVVYFNEINTVPGSLAYYLFCNSFAEFKDLLDSLIDEGKRKFNREKNKKVCIKLGVLNNTNIISKYKR